PRSLAIKFDLYNNSGEGINSTGIFTGGRSPTLRQPGLAPGFPDTSISLDGTGVDLHNGHVFTATLSYDGTTLTETIKDTVAGTSTLSKLATLSGPITLAGSGAPVAVLPDSTGAVTAPGDVYDDSELALLSSSGQGKTYTLLSGTGPGATQPESATWAADA